MYAVILIRGLVGKTDAIKDTLKMLHLNRKNHCVLIPENESYKGMLVKVRHLITWGEINDDILKKMILKRGRKLGDVRVSKEEADLEFIIIKEGKKSGTIKKVFRLTPPSKGFKKSIKQHFPKGELGYRGEKINELIKRMI